MSIPLARSRCPLPFPSGRASRHRWEPLTASHHVGLVGAFAHGGPRYPPYRTNSDGKEKMLSSASHWQASSGLRAARRREPRCLAQVVLRFPERVGVCASGVDQTFSVSASVMRLSIGRRTARQMLAPVLGRRRSCADYLPRRGGGRMILARLKVHGFRWAPTTVRATLETAPVPDLRSY